MLHVVHERIQTTKERVLGPEVGRQGATTVLPAVRAQKRRNVLLCIQDGGQRRDKADPLPTALATLSNGHKICIRVPVLFLLLSTKLNGVERGRTQRLALQSQPLARRHSQLRLKKVHGSRHPLPNLLSALLHHLKRSTEECLAHLQRALLPITPLRAVKQVCTPRFCSVHHHFEEPVERACIGTCPRNRRGEQLLQRPASLGAVCR